MSRKSSSVIFLLTLVLSVFGSGMLFGETPGAHPAYLHALSDLRHARAHLDKLAPSELVDKEEILAIESIDRAIGEIKKAAIDDGKRLEDHPPIDVKLDKKGRFRQAIKLLRAAENDVSKAEANIGAIHLRALALKHIKEAIRIVEKHLKVISK